MDLAVANFSSASVSGLLNNGAGSFGSHVMYAVGDAPRSVFASDLDGDGDIDLATSNSYSDNVSVLLNIAETGVEMTEGIAAVRFSLSQNYPNPFNPSTAISYTVPTRCHVTVTICNVLGQRVSTIVDEVQSAGKHTAYWDGIDHAGRVVASGVYFYQIGAGELTEKRQMVLLK